MKYSTNLKLKKPDQVDFYDVDDFNANSDILDTEISKIKNSYVTSVNGKKGAVTIPIATKVQAETGTDDTVYMSPLKTKDAIQKFAPLKTVNNQKPDSNGNVNVKEYTHPVSGVNAGTYRKVTVNAEGHVTAGVGGAVSVAEGGTGATTAEQARINLGVNELYTKVLPNWGGAVNVPITSTSGFAYTPSTNGWIHITGKVADGSYDCTVYHNDVNGFKILSVDSPARYVDAITTMALVAGSQKLWIHSTSTSRYTIYFIPCKG